MIENFNERFEGGEVGKITERLYRELRSHFEGTHQSAMRVNEKPVTGTISFTLIDHERVAAEEWMKLSGEARLACRNYQHEAAQPQVHLEISDVTQRVDITITNSK